MLPLPQWSLRTVLGAEGTTRWYGPPRGGVRPGVAVTDDSVLPAGPPGRRLVRVGRLQTGGTSPVGSAPVRRW